MEYTPPTPKDTEQKPTYELQKDVTGKPPPKRGPQILKVPIKNEKGETILVEAKVPRLPKANCKKCFGRGYIGLDLRTSKPCMCNKCYPMK